MELEEQGQLDEGHQDLAQIYVKFDQQIIQGHLTEIVEHLRSAIMDFMDLTTSTSVQSQLSYMLSYDIFKLRNRFLVYYHQENYKHRQKLAKYLNYFYQIIEEEYLDQQSQANQEAFYNKKIKECFTLKQQEESD